MTEKKVDLEARLTAYYRSLIPPDSVRLSARAARQVTDARASLPVSARVHFVPRFAGSVLLAAAIVAAVIMIPLLRPAVSPAGPTSVPATLPPNLTDSAVAAAGIIRSGGIWAIKGSLLLTSVDGGETWQATNGPSSTYSNGVVRQPSLLMLDREHAWAVSLASQVGNESRSTPTPDGMARIVVERTADGGRSWQQTGLPGAYPGDVALDFADARHGFLTSLNPGATSSTVFRTNDGGASWSIVTSSAATDAGPLGWQLTASDANTLWATASSQEQGSPVAMLAVSRDGGLTWTAIAPPGAPLIHESGGPALSLGPPTFFDASNGVFAVAASSAGQGGLGTMRIYRTADGGRSWQLASSRQAPFSISEWSAVSPTHWAVVDMWTVSTTDDGGVHWQDVQLAGISQPNVFIHTEFADSQHGLGYTAIGLLEGYPLFVTADGGRTWRPAEFGAALSVPSALPSQDEASVRQVVDDFEVARSKGLWQSAWDTLSPWSERAFGGQQSLQAWQEGLTAGGWRPDAVTSVTVLTPSLGRAWGPLYDDLLANGESGRAYEVAVVHAELNGGDNAKETLIVAPLKGGGWRIWLALKPTPSAPTTPGGGS